MDNKNHETKVRSAKSQPFQLPGHPGRPPATVFSEHSAVYIKNGDDVDHLLSLLGAGRDLLTVIELPQEGTPVAILRGIFPTKITAAPGEKGLIKPS